MPSAKRCPRCRETKPLEEFNRNRAKKDGRQGTCVPCMVVLRRTTQRASDLRRRYDMSVEEFNSLEEKQGGVCAVCLRPPASGRWSGRLRIDHNHETSEVRGLLCDPCNLGLGLFSDNPEALMRAAEYLVS